LNGLRFWHFVNIKLIKSIGYAISGPKGIGVFDLTRWKNWLYLYESSKNNALKFKHLRPLRELLAFAGDFCERTYAHSAFSGLFSQKVGVLQPW
jgi:hypothetical protein